MAEAGWLLADRQDRQALRRSRRRFRLAPLSTWITNGQWAQRNSTSHGAAAGKAALSWLGSPAGVKQRRQTGRWAAPVPRGSIVECQGQGQLGRWNLGCGVPWRAPGSGRNQRRLHSPALVRTSPAPATLAGTACCCGQLHAVPPERQLADLPISAATPRRLACGQPADAMASTFWLENDDHHPGGVMPAPWRRSDAAVQTATARHRSAPGCPPRAGGVRGLWAP